MFPDSRIFVACLALGIVLGLAVARGLPWLWYVALKPFLVWLVI